MGWRLIDTDLEDPYIVTAADDAIAQARKHNLTTNTLHFYRRNTPTISIGRIQKIHDDVNLAYCTKNHITLIRRTTGGGTIYTDPGCLIYSLIFSHRTMGVSTPQELFNRICRTIVFGLHNLHIPTEFAPPNDILLNGKKISGSAQIRKNNITLIHGTILINTDLTIMEQALKHPSKKPVTTLQTELHQTIPHQDIKKVLKQQFETLFQTSIEPNHLTDYEQNRIHHLITTRYTNQEWTYKR